MRVLYIDGVGPFGGASRSLYEVVRALPAGSVEPYFLAARGTALTFYQELAKDSVGTVGLTRLDNTLYGWYRGVRWLVLGREIWHIPFMIAAFIEAKRRWSKIDLVHVNEVTEILPGLIAGYLFNAPVVLHVRSLVRKDEKSLRCRWFNHMMRNKMSAVIAIDQNVRASIPDDVPVEVINNSFTPTRPAVPDTNIVKRIEALPPATLTVGFVGSLFVVKGLFDLVEAAVLVREKGRRVRYLIVGDVARSDRGFKAWTLEALGLAQDLKLRLAERIREHKLEDIFHLLGHTKDIQAAYERMDVVAFPSHYDAPGRPIFEAAFYAVPSIAAVRNPRPDTLIDHETGIAIPPREPAKIAEAIMYFADHPEEVKRMGANARRLAEDNFVPSRNAHRLLNVYERVLAARSATNKEQVPGSNS
jgi:glycosyltransferase involved in cell wall biosynthesis